MYGLRFLVNIHRVGRRLVAWVDEQPLQPWASQHDGLLRQVHAAEEDLAQVGMHNGLGWRGLTRPDLRRELGIVDRH